MKRLVVLALAACGDNIHPDGVALEPAPELAIVAHPDDDLIFMQPDTANAVAAGRGLTTVYVTAGADLEGAALRAEGVRAAYATGETWDCGWIDVAGHAVEHCRLDRRRLSLVFLGYPDGGKEGQQPASLLRLWTGEIETATTIARVETTYDRDGLVDTLAEIIRVTGPDTIRTLDLAGTHGRDHADHLVAGAIATVAAARAGHAGDLVWFRGYNVDGEPPNQTDVDHARALAMIGRYHACASDCGTCGGVCTELPEQHVAWSQRRYAATRVVHDGLLKLGDRCAMLAGDEVALGSCDSSPTWELDGELRAGERCATIDDDRVHMATSCTPVIADSEGHVWAATTPHRCLGADDDAVRALPCGEGYDPRWVFETR